VSVPRTDPHGVAHYNLLVDFDPILRFAHGLFGTATEQVLGGVALLLVVALVVVTRRTAVRRSRHG
jgi:hypothetical protein